MRGLNDVSLADLRKYPVTEQGDRSDRWRGIQHHDLAAAVIDRAEHAGLAIKGDRWQVNESGAQLFGHLSLDLPKEQKFWMTPKVKECFEKAKQIHKGDRWMKDFEPEINDFGLGIRHSNDSSLSLQIVAVLTVKVCGNGWVVEEGTICIARKHTTGLSLAEELDRGIDIWKSRLFSARETREKLAAVEVNGNLPKILVEAGRSGAFPWSKLGQVDELYRNPDHDEFKDRNGWSLYQSFTQVAKSMSLPRQMKAVEDVRDLILA